MFSVDALLKITRNYDNSLKQQEIFCYSENFKKEKEKHNVVETPYMN